EKTKLLIKRLENYSKTYNHKEGYYNDAPKHDQNSHGADAWRYLAVAQKSLEIYNPNRIFGEEDTIQKHCSKYSGL
ncbi:unnamed protein product, partial [marine sediment metagenome]